jgi:hypothetical protein
MDHYRFTILNIFLLVNGYQEMDYACILINTYITLITLEKLLTVNILMRVR